MTRPLWSLRPAKWFGLRRRRLGVVANARHPFFPDAHSIHSAPRKWRIMIKDYLLCHRPAQRVVRSAGLNLQLPDSKSGTLSS